jgi:hypothetical protein
MLGCCKTACKAFVTRYAAKEGGEPPTFYLEVGAPWQAGKDASRPTCTCVRFSSRWVLFPNKNGEANVPGGATSI